MIGQLMGVLLPEISHFSKNCLLGIVLSYYLHPAKFACQNIIAHVLCGNGIFGRRLDHVSTALMNYCSVLTKNILY
jgi:hypothetical protein